MCSVKLCVTCTYVYVCAWSLQGQKKCISVEWNTEDAGGSGNK